MAYNTQKLYDEALKAINKHGLFFIEDVVSLLPRDKSTFYRHFPVDCNEYNALKEKMEANKVVMKAKMRSKWMKSEAPALQLALYKLAASPEELQKLQMQYVDHTTKGEAITLKDLIKFE